MRLAARLKVGRAQIYSKKDEELSDKVATLQIKVIELDKALTEKVRSAMSEWSASKPVQGDLAPADALSQLSLFHNNLGRLSKEQADVARAKVALGMEEVLAGVKLSSVVQEVADLKDVWMSLVQPHEQLAALGDTAWNAVVAHKVRASLEDIQARLRQLPSMTRQYAACEHLGRVIKGHLACNAMVLDLKSQVRAGRPPVLLLMAAMCAYLQLLACFDPCACACACACACGRQ